MCNDQSAPSVNHGPVIVVDEFSDDASSDRATSIASSSTSLSSSILQHRIENGRTYHKYKEGKYNYPNDEKESDRLDLQHNLYLLTLDYKLGLAPPNENNKAQRVLDIGTGTGLWAIDFGDEHPEAEVLGIDLTPVPTAFVPPNVKFEVDDAEEPWTFSQPFDYIHIRGMTSSIGDWKKFFQKTFNNLKPGGYVELFEGHMRPDCDDGTLTSDHAFIKWDPHYKELGEWNLENFLEGIEGWSMAPLTRALQWTKEEVNVFLIQVRNDLKDRRIHAYTPLYLIHARRPPATEA
ncbi:hypothetical protein HER10_EVM0002621 [Colletotrichum scovillei]|uniref:uncharacterized protein n=1 Tax=Colletotrichum scovillei TaxID=1209932 RepID=UPI0015C2EE2A|nr:uncharacterized protein HER10_EVM0002621 [Colletotrichum scovillei]KAF4777492.1 hypothetical protein HER10_EVM0002621 [Colletotrichum scovillei]